MFVGSIVPVSPLIYDAKDTATVDPETSAMPISPARCDAILFDVDGVILDSKANMAAAWAAVDLPGGRRRRVQGSKARKLPSRVSPPTASHWI